ncbi:MAG: T9SS type A sorting domain-containing protein [Bacteroidia bacterium]|nr:T9SS type A sorting domain-containing protein [Bacteroidia bacterium]
MKKLFFLLFTGIVINTVAQPMLSIGRPMPINMNDTVVAGGTYAYDIFLTNIGNQPFSDSVSIYTAVLDSFLGFSVVSVFHSNSIVSLFPSDSVFFTLTETYNLSPLGYKTGIDVIVVWPIAASAIAIDSLMFELFILDPTSISEFDVQQLIKIFPNPTFDNCTFDLPDGYSIKSVRLFDMQGKEVAVQLNGSCIGLQQLALGVYLIDVELQSNKHLKAKIIKK